MAKESEIFNRFGLTIGEGKVLLAAAERSMSPSALAEELGVGRSRITPLVQSLVEKGFLERLESATDRRVRELTLTPAGEKAAADAENFRLGFHRRLLERFGEGERQDLLLVLRRLHDRMMEVRESMKQDF